MLDKLSYLYIFLQSNLIEVIIYFIFYRLILSFKKSALLTTMANSVTHPIVFFGFMAFKASYLQSIILAESFAILAEAVLHSYCGRISIKRTLIASSAANLISWQLAPTLTWFVFFR